MFFMDKDDHGGGAMSEADFRNTVLGGVKGLKDSQESAKKTIEDLTKDFGVIKDDNETLKNEQSEIAKSILELRKARVTGAAARAIRPNHVSEEVARALGGLAILDAVQCGKFLDSNVRKTAEGVFKDVFGVEVRASLSTGDIPLPVGYSGEVAELVYQYSQARQNGTVFPLPNGTFKTPKLGTDPTFGLIAQSGSVTEKSPGFGWVTFTAEKFGGLVRLPSEIDDDSIVAVGQFIARYAARQMGRAEDWNFFRGTGAATGINGTAQGLTTSCVTDGIVINQAATKTKQSDMTLDNLRDLRSQSGISGVVLGDSKYYMHPTYEAALVKFNTSATVTPFQRNGREAMLDGYPIVWTSVMPAYSSTASVSLGHVLFGDVTWNYLGVRGGMRFDTSKEAGFVTDEILIRALERFTIGKMAVDPVAVLVTAAA